MKDKKVNKKAFWFFTFLVVFSFLAVKLVKGLEKETKPVANLAPKVEECSTCGVKEIPTEVLDESETDSLNIAYVEESQTIDITEKLSNVDKEVLGTNLNCASIKNSLSSIRVACSTGGGGINFSNGSPTSSGGGFLVTKDTKIELVKVTYPLALMLGQFTFKDSRKQITKTTPEYKSSGEQIDEVYVSKTLSPAEAVEFSESIKGTERENYEVEGRVKSNIAPEGGQSSPKGKYAVTNADHNPIPSCYEKEHEKEIAIGDYNVGKSNYIASDKDNGGYARQQIPGGDNLIPIESNECLAEGEDFKRDKFTLTACNKKAAIIAGKLKKFFSPTQWDVCKPKPPGGGPVKQDIMGVEDGQCVDPASIVVEMTPIFGSPYECTNELCANAFLTYMQKGTLAPTQSKAKMAKGSSPKNSLMFFVGTKCGATIDGLYTDVTCLWDMSPLLANYNLEAKDKAPKQDDFPKNFDVYWRSVEVARDRSARQYGIAE